MDGLDLKELRGLYSTMTRSSSTYTSSGRVSTKGASLAWHFYRGSGRLHSVTIEYSRVRNQLQFGTLDNVILDLHLYALTLYGQRISHPAFA